MASLPAKPSMGVCPLTSYVVSALLMSLQYPIHAWHTADAQYIQGACLSCRRLPDWPDDFQTGQMEDPALS